MAYVTTSDAGFRLTTTSGLATWIGKIRMLFEKLVEREIIQADAENTPTERPVDLLDARVVVETLDAAMGVSEGASAANLTANFTTADGGSGSLVMGPLVGSGVQHDKSRRTGGFRHQQTLEMKGSALTYTPTV